MSNSGTSRPWHGLVYGDGGTGVAGGGFCLSTTTKTELMEEVGSVPPEVESTSSTPSSPIGPQSVRTKHYVEMRLASSLLAVSDLVGYWLVLMSK